MKKTLNNNIFFVKNSDFHTLQIKVIFPFYDKEENIANLILLPAMVSFMNQEYDTEEKFQKNRQKNYILSTGCSKSILGTNVFFSYSMNIPDVDALGFNHLDKQFEFFEKFIYHPKVINNGFDEFQLDREKKDLKTRIANNLKTLRGYSGIRFVEEYDTEGLLSRGIHNHMNLIDEMTPESLYNFYKENIYNNKPIVFVFGNFNEDEMTSLINKYLIKSTGEISYELDLNHFLEPRDEVHIVNEKGHFKDSSLSLAYKVKDMTEDDFAYLGMVSGLLSSLSSRLLQKKLRDEHELIYSSSSSIALRFGVLEINSYINKNNKDLVIEKIHEVMNSLKDEKYIEEFINNLIDRNRISLIQLKDNKYGMFDEAICKTLGLDMTGEEKYNILKNIKPKDISDFIDRLVLDTIYFVEEGENE